MRYAIYYPLTPKAGYESIYLDEEIFEQRLAGCIEARRPVVMCHQAIRNASNIGHKTDKAIVKVSLTKTSIRDTLSLDISFTGEHSGHYWAIKVKLRLPQGMEITKLTFTGMPNRIPDDVYTTQLAALPGILQALHDPAIPAPLQLNATTGIARCDGLRAAIEDGAALWRQSCAERDENREKDLLERHAGLNALPNGVPLQIWDGLYSHTWSLGIKRGDIPKAMARRVNMLPPEMLASDALRRAGMSRHRELILTVAARKAIESCDPALTRPIKGHLQHHKLNPKKAFDESFHDLEALRAKRRAMPKIWIQTRVDYGTRGYLLQDPGLKWDNWNRFLGSCPSFPNTDDAEHTELELHRVDRGWRNNALKDLAKVCGLTLVSDALMVLLQEHNLGRNGFRKIDFYDHVTEQTSTKTLLVMREDHTCVDLNQMVPAGSGNLNYRTISEYEVVMDGRAHGDLDLWFDRQISPNLLFVSDRLARSLRKAKLDLKLALKRCEVK